MRRAAVGLISLALALTAGPAFAAPKNVDIQKVSLDEFPRVNVSLSTAGLQEPEFVVTENGTAVGGVKVETFAEAGRQVDVVLVIDTSGSMEGAPLAAALDAARSFVRSVPDNIKVGIVTFSDDPRVALPLTLDRDRAQDVLNGLVAEGETAMYDAVDTAARLFSGDAQRNIVLLSDGGDTASSTTLASAVAATKESGASVYAVGLTTGEFDEAALKRLSASGRGRYSPAGTADLTSLYEGLADELENQFALSYKSQVEGGSQFTLAVASGEVSDSAELLAPEITVPEPPQRRVVEPPSEPLLNGTGGLLVVMALTFVALALIAYSFMGAQARRRRDQELARLIAATPTHDGSRSDRSEEGPVSWLPDSLVDAAGSVARNTSWSATLDRKLDRAGLGINPGEFLAGSMVAALGGALVGIALTQSIPLGFLIAIVAAFVPYLVLTVKVSRRYAKLQSQLPDILMILASSLRAGHSFLQALDAVANEIGDPGAREFSRLVAEIRLGRPVSDAMNDLAERIDSDDFRWAILAVNVQREVGGNLAEVLDTVATTMRGRDNVRRQVKVLSAEGRLSMYILGALPLMIALYLSLVNPTYLALLYQTRIGVVLIVVAVCLYFLGFVWMRKVVKIHV